MRTIGWSLALYCGVLIGLSLTAHNPVLLGICCFLIGCSFVVGPALQTRLMDVAGDAQTLAAALNHSAFNVANALGALFGGMAISAGYGYESMGFVGAVMAVVGLGVFLVSMTLDKMDRAAAPACPRNRRPESRQSAASLPGRRFCFVCWSNDVAVAPAASARVSAQAHPFPTGTNTLRRSQNGRRRMLPR